MTAPRKERHELRLVTQEEAARILRVHTSVVRAWMESGELASRQHGPTNRSRRTTLFAIEAFQRIGATS